MGRQTHTYVVLELSPAAFGEIKEKLEAAGYQHAFDENDGRTIIDMHGIAVATPKTTNERTRPTNKSTGR